MIDDELEQDTYLIDKRKAEIMDSLDIIMDYVMDDIEPKWSELNLEFYDSLKYGLDEVKSYWN